MILLFLLFSPLIPDLYFIYRMTKEKNSQLKYSLIILGLSIASYLFAQLGMNSIEGWNSLIFTGFFYVGQWGMIIGCFLVLIFGLMKIMDKWI